MARFSSNCRAGRVFEARRFDTGARRASLEDSLDPPDNFPSSPGWPGRDNEMRNQAAEQFGPARPGFPIRSIHSMGHPALDPVKRIGQNF